MAGCACAGRIDRASTKRLGKTLASGGDKQARVEDSGASAQDPSSLRELEPTSVDDEVNMLEVEGLVKSQAEQAAEAIRRRQRGPTGGCARRMSCCHAARTCSKGILKSMTKECTALSPSTMRSRWLLHHCEDTQCGLEDFSCSSQHIPADVDGEYDDLARPSSIGSASELTILTCRISVQQCCLEIDSVSRFTGFRRGKF